MVWVFCLAIGTCTHVADLIYGRNEGVPIASAIFWNSLTILDPLAIALFFVRPRFGVVLTLAIMVADVAHNVWAIAALDVMVWPVVAQALFLIFVLATAHLIWRDAASPAVDPAQLLLGPHR